MPTPTLTNDARNRALRTFLQGLGYAVLAAIVMVLYPVFKDAHSWGDLHWRLLSFSLIQAAGMAVLSYFMRRVLDPSGVPTPLPPENPGQPTDETGAVDLVTIFYVLGILFFTVATLWLLGVPTRGVFG